MIYKEPMNFPIQALFIFLLLLLVFTSCQKNKNTSATSRKILKTCLNTEPSTIDPRKNADVFSSTINFLLYEGLTRILPDGEAEMALASSVDISKDGRIYTFHLRKAEWSDGHPITAHDFEYSWKKILDHKFGSPCSQIFFPIKNGEKCIKQILSSDSVGIKAIDDLTLQVELENPTPYFLSLITFCNFFPIPKHIELQNPNWFQTPETNLIGSGPFLIKKWKRNQEITLIKNPTYWDSENVYLEEIQFSIIPDGRTSFQMFENKELDFISTVTTPLLSEDLAEIKKTNNLKITPISGLLFCTFNLEKYPYQNANIRKALSYAINRQPIVENISQLSEKIATRCIAPIMVKQKNRTLFPSFDPILAKEFFLKGLEELNIPPSQSDSLNEFFILSYNNEEPYKKIAEVIQQQWKQVLGIDVQLQEKDHKSHLSNIMDKNYCVALYNCIAQCTDPTNILDRFKHKEGKKNYPGFENQTYIELLDKAASLNDPIQRMSLLDDAEALLMSEMPIAPIYHFNQGILINPDFIHVEFSPLFNLLFKKIKRIDPTQNTESSLLNTKRS